MAGGQVKAGGGRFQQVHKADVWVELQFCDPSRGERTKVETLEWRLKTLILCFLLSLYFWAPGSPLFWDVTV